MKAIRKQACQYGTITTCHHLLLPRDRAVLSAPHTGSTLSHDVHIGLGPHTHSLSYAEMRVIGVGLSLVHWKIHRPGGHSRKSVNHRHSWPLLA